MSVETGQAGGKPRRLLVLLPLLVFAALAAIFLLQLMSGRDGATIPSALLGREAPQTALPPIEGLGLPGLDSADFAGKVTLVNVWASWCAPCREEHPLLMEISRNERIVVAGLNYKDQPENARRFLGEMGNPFDRVGADLSGRTAIDWGVYGAPETFLVGRDGRIVYKHVGPFTPESARGELLPAIKKALAGG